MDSLQIHSISVLIWVFVLGTVVYYLNENREKFLLSYRLWLIVGSAVSMLFLLWSIWDTKGTFLFIVWSLIWSYIKIYKNRVHRSILPSTIDDSSLPLNRFFAYPQIRYGNWNVYSTDFAFRSTAYVWHVANDLIAFFSVYIIGRFLEKIIVKISSLFEL
ncbi:MAG: hypothetical protein KBC49_02325 [Candidatus Pacebacteria bacterium]|nr:hypothetical protein [Candidatus Paceibacterota bacterium]